MMTTNTDTLSFGLLAHLHLSAAEAAVMVDSRQRSCKLVVFIYDKDAARRTKHISEWAGVPVEYVAEGHSPYRT